MVRVINEKRNRRKKGMVRVIKEKGREGRKVWGG